MNNQQFVVKGDGRVKDVDVTGAQRDNQEGKYRFDLIGLHMLKRLANLLAAGAKKYSERNWEKGQKASRTLASLWRHLVAYQEGDRVEDHLASIIFNAMSIINVEEEVRAGRLPEELLDLSFYDNLPEFREALRQKVESGELAHCEPLGLVEDRNGIYRFRTVLDMAQPELEALSELNRRWREREEQDNFISEGWHKSPEGDELPQDDTVAGEFEGRDFEATYNGQTISGSSKDFNRYNRPSTDTWQGIATPDWYR